MSLSTKVLLYDTPTLLDMTEKEFMSAVHNKDPAYILLYSLPWKEFTDIATCVNCASKSIIMPCKFGMLNLDNNARVQKRYNITQKNRIMLFKNNRMYFLPMQDLSISAFERFLTVGFKQAVYASLPTRYSVRSSCKNLCADLVGVWCDKVGTFIVVMAFIGIVLVALFIILTSNKSSLQITTG